MVGYIQQYSDCVPNRSRMPSKEFGQRPTNVFLPPMNLKASNMEFMASNRVFLHPRKPNPSSRDKYAQ